MKGRCGMQERDTKKHSMATEEHALKIKRPWHCQSELSQLSTENVSQSKKQRPTNSNHQSTRGSREQRAACAESSVFSCQILFDNRRQCQCRNQSSSRDLQESRKVTLELTHPLSAHCVLYCERTRRVQLCRSCALLALDRVGSTSAQCALDVCVSSSVHVQTFLVDLGMR